MNTVDKSAGAPLAETQAMLQQQIVARGLHDPRVLAAMAAVDRGAFVPEAMRVNAYEDRPLPIGQEQTISQPYMVACMTALLALRPGARVLEVGTGSGYQAAVLAQLAGSVITVERHAALADAARARLAALGYQNVVVHHADGTLGWPEGAPYDAILVTAGAPEVPAALLAQLAPGGTLVCPVGTRAEQRLVVVHQGEAGLEQHYDTRCLFVPLLGAQGWPVG